MTKPDIPPFEYGDARLRLLRAEDLALTLAWRNLAHIRRWFFTSEIISMEQHTLWFKQYSEREDDFVFIIEEIRRGGLPVGQVALYNIDYTAREAEFGRLMIGEASAAGKGLGLDATRAVLRFAFAKLHLDKVHLEVFHDNAKAIHIYQSVGFKSALTAGEHLQMSITAGHELG